jgi:NDP-sugar pyrophosphorylase family protein
MSRFPVAVLAGGLATRLGSLARETPKCLIDVGGAPFVHRQLQLLRSQEVSRVVLCIGHHGEKVIEAVGDGSAFGLEVVYSHDGTEPRGTAGALRNALPLLGDSFFVLYGDSYLECDFGEVQGAYHDAGLPSLMTVFRNDGKWDASNVEFNEGCIVAYDKSRRTNQMHHIDYGLGIFDRRVFDLVPDRGPFDLAVLYQEMLRRGILAGFEVSQRFYEIGSLAGLQEARNHLAVRV